MPLAKFKKIFKPTLPFMKVVCMFPVTVVWGLVGHSVIFKRLITLYLLARVLIMGFVVNIG